MPNIGTYRGIAIYYQEARDRYRMWYTDDKGRKKPVYGKTRKQVEDNYDKLQEDLRKGLYIANMPDTLLKLMNQMIDEQEEDKNLKQNSINRKRDTANIVREHIKCSRKRIQKIKEDELNEDLKKLADMKKFVQSKNKYDYRFSQSYINKIYSLIRETFNYAVIKRKMTKEQNLFEVEGRVKKPKSNKATKEVKPFTRQECIKFLEQLNKEEPSQIIDIIKIQLLSGLRIGETLALINENIDIEERKIYVETTLTKDKKDKSVRGDTTKTPSGKRSYPLTYSLQEIIEPYLKPNKPKALIFSNNGKTAISESNVCRVVKRTCTHGGIRIITVKKRKADGRISELKSANITTHSLRHLFASIAVIVKADPTVLRDLLGHKSVAVTYDVYANGTFDQMESTVEKVEDFYTGLTLETANADMEKLLKIISTLKVHTLEEKEITHYKREIVRVIYIPKLEKDINTLILKISKIEDTTEDTQERLNLIYNLLTNMETFKIQTRELKRDINQCNENYNYIFNYIQTTQYLIKAMEKAKKYEPKKKPATISTFAVNY